MVAPPVRAWLRFEGFTILAAGVTVWAALSGSWFWFLLLFLVPDLSMAMYLAGPRIGAAAYNAAHSYAVPVLLALAGGVVDSRSTLLAAALWLSHIGFDRMLGYGLKYPSGFRDTHLGTIGRGSRRLHTDEFMAVQFERYRTSASQEDRESHP